MMRFDKLTVKAQEAVQAAQSLADQGNHQALEPEHLLLALIQQQEGVVGPLLGKLGARPEAIVRQVEAELDKLPKVSGGGRQYVGPRLEKALGVAWDEAQRLKDEYCPPSTSSSASPRRRRAPPRGCSPRRA
ncbi:MAG TPA: Clp protease N-terminal domain-containing protein [Candidatus Nitrosocosmicus sp.]|nr:Clp protease N-terminal domain-containing protein [Candidatus Nitrosocosmicus sp.]